MAAGEQQPQPVVGDAARVGFPGRASVRAPLTRHGELPQLGGFDVAPAEPVDGPVPGRGHDPRPGPVRHPVGRPAGERLRERLLRAFLGEVPVSGHPDQGGDDLAPLLAERVRDDLVDVDAHS
jgi:hypothetical protein